jgi:hypothetical protein
MPKINTTIKYLLLGTILIPIAACLSCRGSASPPQTSGEKWVTVASKEDGFSIRFPYAVKKVTKNDTPAEGQPRTHQWGCGSKDGWYYINCVIYKKDQIEGIKPDALFNSFAEVLRNSVQGKITQNKPVSLRSHRGREVVIKAPNGMGVKLRVFLVGQKLYAPSFAGSETAALSPKTKQFLDSLKLN